MSGNGVLNIPNNYDKRPYLVVPKLIEQPTWGGDYISKTKGWLNRAEMRGKKIGQSYELFSGSNLSLLTDSSDPNFVGELHDRDSAQLPSEVSDSIPLPRLVQESAETILGKDIIKQRGDSINLLIKFTQALGNSFQVHLKDSQTDPCWKPKPESWYYFEPGLVTLGVKDDAWQDYQVAVEAVDAGMRDIGEQINSNQITYEQSKSKIQALIKQHDPWQFVNLVDVAKDEVIDPSVGGIHHSWEEDTERLPLGNVLYELQTDTMDDVSTLRSFDRGKIGSDGHLRDLHIKDYFRIIDRSKEANNPKTHKRLPKQVSNTEQHELLSLLQTKYYELEKLILKHNGSEYPEKIDQFVHLFVKCGQVLVKTSEGEVLVGEGHSCFVPAGAREYRVVCRKDRAEVLISK